MAHDPDHLFSAKKALGIVMLHPALSLLSAFVLASGVRLLLWARYYCINNDGVLYIEIARWLWQGEWGLALDAYFPPFYPFLIVLVYPLTRDWEIAGQFSAVFLGVLTIFPLYGLLKRVYNAKIASLAVFFFAISPYLVRYSLHVRSESPYIFFFVLSLYFFQRGMEGERLGSFFSAGASAAAAYLARPEGIGVLIAGSIFLVYRGSLKAGLTKALKQVVILAVGFFLFASPYILYLKSDTGHWSISRKLGANVAWGMAEHDESRLVTQASGEIGALQLIFSHPSLYARKVSIDLFRSLGVYLEALHYSYIPFLAAGWLVFFRSRFWEREDFFFAWFVFFYLFVFAVLQVNRRFAVPLIPLSLAWVASGFLVLEDFCYKRWQKYGPVVIGSVLIVFLLGTLPKALHPIGLDKLYLREAGIYLKGKEGAEIFTTQGRVSFYAGRLTGLPVVTEPQVLDLLSARKGDYLAMEERTFRPIEAFYKKAWIIDKEFVGQKGERFLVLRREGGMR